jgi:hypothetical protein
MAMAITMRMVARFFFFATEATQDTRAIVKCQVPIEDTTKMRAHSRGTCLADLAADPTKADD